ncbi:uncharacterized protein B0T15DRAFT_519366 [Chaetomium strumarium]|uniref:EGF-like domain-containing protein n=1 Tax=Chaetomium strumarium TaxID=1170767 RepID=A0AAJ0H2R2_9PEZI|nr:hypothetical protein B0T15DRAFT_519366 [Chaetomium strumarium]
MPSRGRSVIDSPNPPSSDSRPPRPSRVPFPPPRPPRPSGVPSISDAPKGLDLGPPPSARRLDSSLYSGAPYVSPIPEESPRSRSHASYASSAAMPEDDTDRLVRNASVGKRAKPTLVSAAPSRGLESRDRRPPPLDIDSVRRAEARGSITSLPDLIRRATRLAASLERGRRPASRFDDLDDSHHEARDNGRVPERYQSGLSDMLAAFPPPAHPPSRQNRRSIRDSMRGQIQSWPLPVHFYRAPNTSQDAVPYSDSQRSDRKRRRRCCGLPIWGCIFLALVILILVAAAVVLPVYFYVIRKQETPSQNAAQQCQQQLACANGGRSMAINGKCSCVCSAGFTGPDCTTVDTTGCTTISLANPGNSDNFTIGNAIPRLIQQAHTNFSIQLAANEILARFSSGNLSCTAENALVTFNGRATRQETPSNQAAFVNSANAVIINGIFYVTITVVIAPQTTFTLPPTWSTSGAGDGTSVSTSVSTSVLTSVSTSVTSGSVSSQPPPSVTSAPTATSKVTTTTTMSSGAPLPTSMFPVTEDVLDFARVAVLYILQEDNLADAELAQLALQNFLSSGNSVDAARNVPIGGGQSVDLVDFVINMGGSGGKVGGVSSVAARGRIGGVGDFWGRRIRI